jgi:hypothetical protein
MRYRCGIITDMRTKIQASATLTITIWRSTHPAAARRRQHIHHRWLVWPNDLNEGQVAHACVKSFKRVANYSCERRLNACIHQ